MLVWERTEILQTLQSICIRFLSINKEGLKPWIYLSSFTSESATLFQIKIGMKANFGNIPIDDN